MPRIASLDHLLAVLRERIFLWTWHLVPLRYRFAANGERDTVAGESRAGWRKADRNLVGGEPDGHYWFGGTIAMPRRACLQGHLGRRPRPVPRNQV